MSRLQFDKICAVVAAADAKSMRRQLEEALGKTRTVELRLDWLSSDREITSFLSWLAGRRTEAILIATCRRREAGGRYAGSIAKELLHLAEAIRAGCGWYDLETETASKCPAELLDALLGEGLQITSAHFFECMPARLEAEAARLERAGGGSEMIKIAAHCESLAEAEKLIRFARARRKRGMIAIAMGDVALPARFLATRDGSVLTYAPVENSTAPGQISLDEMIRVYRAKKLDGRTRVYGVIGNPIGHSLSPVMQNAAFGARAINAVYLPFLVRDLKDFIGAIGPLGIRGFSVTIPYKESILKHLDDCDPLAAKIGAVNTVVVRAGGKLYGYNTDYVGVLRALQPRIALAQSRVLILGAGGAARAVAFALASAGTRVCVCARRMDRAKTLAKEAAGEAIHGAQVRHEYFDAIVNATPVGMHPEAENSPLDAKELNCGLVFDTIYRPRETKLLRFAAKKGIETVSGVEMFTAQGAAQWEIWTGRRAPEDAMRRAVIGVLEKEERMQGAPKGTGKTQGK